jgi:hypothetical protein
MQRQGTERERETAVGDAKSLKEEDRAEDEDEDC